jgi:hypothetical protein
MAQIPQPTTRLADALATCPEVTVPGTYWQSFVCFVYLLTTCWCAEAPLDKWSKEQLQVWLRHANDGKWKHLADGITFCGADVAPSMERPSLLNLLFGDASKEISEALQIFQRKSMLPKCFRFISD